MLVNNQSSAFTLVDLLVAMGIFMLLASLTVANFNQGAKQDSLRQAGWTVASLLEEAQGYALAGRTVNISGGLQVPSGGYGIYFDLSKNNQLVLFPDLNGNGNFDSATETVDGWTYTLPDKVIITTLAPVTPVVSLSFRPPLGDRYINGYLNGGTLGNNLQVVLQHTGSGSTVAVSVNAVSGQINVQ